MSSRPSAVNGLVVAFESVATNLAPGADGRRNVFLRELETGRTELISVTPEGKAGNDKSYAPDLSFDGSVVAFKSDAWNLVSDDTNGVADTFARDRGTGTTERVSVDGFGNEAESASAHPSISADGRYVSFPSFDDFLVSEDGNHQSDVFVYDRFGTRGNRVARVSVEPARHRRNWGSGSPSRCECQWKMDRVFNRLFRLRAARRIRGSR